METVFISYAREDVEFAKKLYRDLESFRLKPWLDLEDILPGMEWQQSITNAIKMSSYFIALISSNSVNKRGFIQKELRQGLDVLEQIPPSQIYIIPVRLEDVTSAYDRIKELQWVDAFPSYNIALRKIISAIVKLNEEDLSLINALRSIRENSHFVYPALRDRVIFNRLTSRPRVILSTLPKIKPSLTTLTEAGVLRYTLKPWRTQTKFEFQYIDIGKLKPLINFVEGDIERTD